MYAPVASLAATGVAMATGSVTVHHCRRLIRDGVSVDEGGGWTVLIVVEFVVTMIAVSAAINL
jgi:hypothetical protein